MRRILIELNEATFTSLSALAIAERRPLRDQASWLLEHAIEEQGATGPP